MRSHNICCFGKIWKIILKLFLLPFRILGTELANLLNFRLLTGIARRHVFKSLVLVLTILSHKIKLHRESNNGFSPGVSVIELCGFAVGKCRT